VCTSNISIQTGDLTIAMRCFLNFYPGTADKSENALLWQAGLHHVRCSASHWTNLSCEERDQLPSVALKRRCKVRSLSETLVITDITKLCAYSQRFVTANWILLSNSW